MVGNEKGQAIATSTIDGNDNETRAGKQLVSAIQEINEGRYLICQKTRTLGLNNLHHAHGEVLVEVIKCRFNALKLAA
jgi:hypothetical protein